MKMKLFFKNSVLYAALFSGLLIGTGCKKHLDINTDPNTPAVDQGTPRLVFPAAVMATAGRVGGDLAILGALWGQYATQSSLSSQYRQLDAYNVDGSQLNGPYTGLFAGGLKNYQFVIDKSAEVEDWNFYLMATVMKAYTAQVLVDIYDQIPYFEALKGSDNLNPKFDDGYTIYKDLLAILDTALGKNFSASTLTNPGTTDLVFGGNMDNWKRFANTLQLKMYLRMINAKAAEAQAGVQKLYARNATFLTVDASVTGFTNIKGKGNPMYEQNIRELNTATNLRASKTFVLFLQDNNDPRITYNFGSATPNSLHQGDYTNNTDASYNTAASLVQRATDPVVFISQAESYFLQAEARERYFAGAGAKALYDAGVLSAFTAEGANGTTFIAAAGKYAYPVAGTLSQKIEAISVQKWVSFSYGLHFIEGFFEKNRTGFPRTSPVYSTSGSYVPGQLVVAKNSVLGPSQFPKRLVFPDVETIRNTEAPAVVPITTPVWWAL